MEWPTESLWPDVCPDMGRTEAMKVVRMWLSSKGKWITPDPPTLKELKAIEIVLIACEDEF